MKDQEKLEKELIDFIDHEFYLKKEVTENGFTYFHGEYYADYREELDEKTIQKIIDSDNPMDKFYSEIDELYELYEYNDTRYEYHSEVVKKIRENFDFDEYLEDIQDSVDLDSYIDEFVCERVSFSPDYNHFLRNASVNMNLCTDFYNESNIDFTANSLHLNGIQYRKTLEKGSITWLVKSQGYTMKQFYDYHFNNNNPTDSKFLRSLKEELLNATYSMNLLTFFVKVDLSDILNNNLYDSKGYYHIDKSINCGLYNPWNGSGGCLDIKLEKDIKIHKKNIHSFSYDGALGYGVEATFGVWGGLWQ